MSFCSCCPALANQSKSRRQASKRPAAKTRKERLRHTQNTQTAWQWKTEWASGQRPVVPNVAFCTYKKLAIFLLSPFLVPLVSWTCSLPLAALVLAVCFLPRWFLQLASCPYSLTRPPAVGRGRRIYTHIYIRMQLYLRDYMYVYIYIYTTIYIYITIYI